MKHYMRFVDGLWILFTRALQLMGAYRLAITLSAWNDRLWIVYCASSVKRSMKRIMRDNH